MNSSETIEQLVASIRDSKQSDFYKKHWGTASSFAQLPAISRGELLRTPLSARRYKEEKGLAKIVRDARGSLLSEWSFRDIGAQSYGLVSKRPMVYMSDTHEAIEKAMWCYEHGMVPLLGEKDPDIASFAAEKYKVDSLITDAAALKRIEPYLKKRAERLDSISILGDSFSPKELAAFEQYADRIRLVLALPEAGAFAEAEFRDYPKFKPIAGYIVESDETLVVTAEGLLVTPIVRYKTEISGIELC
jgi:hypothetical protein